MTVFETISVVKVDYKADTFAESTCSICKNINCNIPVEALSSEKPLSRDMMKAMYRRIAKDCKKYERKSNREIFGPNYTGEKHERFLGY